MLFQNKNKKWIRVVRKNKIIFSQINKYNQLSFLKRDYSFWYFNAGLMVPYFLFGLTLLMMNTFFLTDIENNVLELLFSIVLSSICVALIPFFVLSSVDKMYKEAILNHKFMKSKFVKITNIILFVKTNYFFLILLYSLFWVISYFTINTLDNSWYMYGLLFMYFILLLLLLRTFILLIRINSSFKSYIKFVLNKEKFEDYPFLVIRTKSNNSNTGKMADIFNEEYLILKQDDGRIFVPWNSIDTLELFE